MTESRLVEFLNKLDDVREDFVSDVYNTLDFLPTNDEANRIIDSFDRVIDEVKCEEEYKQIAEELKQLQKIQEIIKIYKSVPTKVMDREDAFIEICKTINE